MLRAFSNNIEVSNNSLIRFEKAESDSAGITMTDSGATIRLNDEGVYSVTLCAVEYEGELSFDIVRKRDGFILADVQDMCQQEAFTIRTILNVGNSFGGKDKEELNVVFTGNMGKILTISIIVRKII